MLTFTMKITTILFVSAQIILTHSCNPKKSSPPSGQVRVTNVSPNFNESSNDNIDWTLTEEKKLKQRQKLPLKYEEVFRGMGMGDEYVTAVMNYENDKENLTLKEIYENQVMERVNNAEREWKHLVDFARTLNPDITDEEDEDLVSQRIKLFIEISEIFDNAKICPYNNQTCDLKKPNQLIIGDRFIESIDYEELSYLWTAWRNATGRKLRGIYTKFVNVDRVLAKKVGLYGHTEVWLASFNSSTFQKDCEAIWDNVKPLYEELHAYIRFKLGERYPSKIKPEDPIPAHLVSNLLGETFEGLFSLLVPFPNVSIDMDVELKKRFSQDLEGIRGMFETANGFFMSMGMMNMSSAYGPKSMLMEPEGKRVSCNPVSYPVGRNDMRIRMCAEVILQDFMIMHHELGHVQHFLSKQNGTYFDRLKPDYPGFEEAVGDVIFLSAGTPQHMAKIGLLENNSSLSKESTINYLMQVGLQKIAVLSFTYVIDAYRWKLFDGTIEPGNWTYYWVKMRSDIQGLIPPVIRDEQDFDIGSKYHVANDLQTISYFVSHILQFQLHKGLCKIAKQYPAQPLHQCDLYGSKEAGTQFSKLLQTGKWENFLEETLGENGMNASALLEYFSPLYEYLKEYRAEKNYPIGWSKTAFKAFVRSG
ncbi:unnamed protein product [Orchesella dallaii]|uniref:Angiotensin-converting enzyme n=1 Tax=Orchesella dallaii TaxID=48710 RepID=A0ABP1Q5K5_9HEXA